MDPGDILYRSEMSAHRLIGFEEGTLGEEMQFKVGEEGREGIGIVPLRDLTIMVGDAKSIRAYSERPRDNGFE
jgi:hypothetical protein